MNLIGEKICLRAMELEDMDCYRDMINDPDMEKLLGGWSRPVSKQQQQDWYTYAINAQDSLRLSVVRKSDSKLLGMVNLVEIDWKNGSAIHGIRLIPGKEYRHQGFGTDAVRTLMRYAFDELRLHRLETTILEYNTISQALYKKCGWTMEGVKRRAVYRQGKYFDLQMWSIILAEYYNINIGKG